MGGKSGGSSEPQLSQYQQYVNNGGKANQQAFYDYNPGFAAQDGWAPPPAPFEMPEFHMPSGPSESDYAAQLAEQQAAAERAAGIKQRDSLYTDYINAASSATDYVNAEIDRERANAALMGVDYNLTDESKSTRISDYFASVWGEGDQANLENLFKQWGNPEGFEDFSIKRGDGSKYKGEEKGSDGTVSVTGGTRPGKKKTIVEEDEQLGGGLTILGGA